MPCDSSRHISSDDNMRHCYSPPHHYCCRPRAQTGLPRSNHSSRPNSRCRRGSFSASQQQHPLPPVYHQASATFTSWLMQVAAIVATFVVVMTALACPYYDLLQNSTVSLLAIVGAGL